MTANTPHPEVVFTEGELLVIYKILKVVRDHPGELVNLNALNAREKIRRLVGHTTTFKGML